ncbi:hypothetical protein C8D77_103171 [Mesorhizobium loti]|uniref:Lipoprotein n=1 Tax=Rhizobium loti TaxID=381 RepID=A0A8E2WCM7_RHILI|nr:hypothetical protein [Mesorhizobium loti]PWJ91474.1 hypothetical protein C8D77_103171 [Mesorhizobium loti]
MQKYLRVFASGILLSGCASGYFIPTQADSAVDYGLLVKGLRCEVESVMAFDRGQTSPKYFYDRTKPRYASIAIQIDGHLDRNAGISASIADHGLGKHGILSASTGLTASTNDVGTVIMGDSVLPDELACKGGDRTKYDMKRLGLLEWYKHISANVQSADTSGYLDEMKFVRTGTVVFGPNGASVAFFNPVTVTPSAGFQVARVVQIEIDFTDQPKKPTIALDQGSLNALAEIIRTGGKSGGGKKKHGKAAGGTDLPSPAEVLRDGQIERLDKSLNNIDTLIRLNGL